MNFITHNAYGILGLSPNATNKEIQKRARDIENLLKIDEIPKYDLDFSHFDKLRNAQNVKEAMQNLLDTKSKIWHYFFAIYIKDEDEKKHFAKRAKNQLLNVDLGAKNFVDKKNLAIFTYFTMFGGEIYVDSKNYLNLWSEILKRESLTQFKNSFRNDNDLMDEEIFNNLNENLKNEIVKLNLHFIDSIKERVSKMEFIKNLITLLEPNDELLLEIKFVNKRFFNINKQNEEISNSKKKEAIETAVKEIENELKKLDDINLTKHTHTRMIRDKIAKNLKSKSVKAWNEKQNGELAEFLAQKALEICDSGLEKDVIRKNLRDLKEARKSKVKHEKISALLRRANRCVDNEQWSELDEVARQMRESGNGELTDQIAIMIGNNIIEENAQILRQNEPSTYDSQSEKIRKLRLIISASENLNNALNKALKYAKKQETINWINRNKVPQDFLNDLKNILNQVTRPVFNPNNQGCLLLILIVIVLMSAPIVLIASS